MDIRTLVATVTLPKSVKEHAILLFCLLVLVNGGDTLVKDLAKRKEQNYFFTTENCIVGSY